MTALTECKEDGEANVSFVKEVKTSADGSFFVPPLPGCGRIRLSAKKVEDLWLETGHDVFYEKDNGTAPLVETKWSGTPTTTEIRLENRGSLVSFRVRDAPSDSFIWAELSLKRVPPAGARPGYVLMIATGRDGGPDTVLLPAGQYEISVDQYSCHGVEYFTNGSPRETFALQAGQRIDKSISVDVRLIKPKSSYNNPGAKPCTP